MYNLEKEKRKKLSPKVILPVCFQVAVLPFLLYVLPFYKTHICTWSCSCSTI